MSSVIDLQIRDNVAYLTLARAAAANTMNLQFGTEFLAATSAIVSSPSVRAIVIAAQGKNFSFGGDLNAMRAAGADIARYLRKLTTDLHAGMLKLARASAPVIAAVNGTAAGAGLGLVLLSDLALAARSARFASAYTAVGLTPDAGCSYLLPRTIGHKRAMELFITNRVLDAQQALEWGLINQVVEDAALAGTAEKLARQLVVAPPQALGALKRLVADSYSDFSAQLDRESISIASRGHSPEGQEAIAAFLEKRPPKFS